MRPVYRLLAKVPLLRSLLALRGALMLVDARQPTQPQPQPQPQPGQPAPPAAEARPRRV